jgi:hypothetical protein
MLSKIVLLMNARFLFWFLMPKGSLSCTCLSLEFASTDDDHAPHHEPMSEWLEAKEVAVLHVYQIASPRQLLQYFQ